MQYMCDEQYNFDLLLDRRGTYCVKWDKQGLETLPFGIADMDFPTFPPMRKAILDRCENGTFGYTFEGESLYSSIIAWFGRRHGLQLKKQDILFAAGTLESLSLILDSFFRAGDKVILCPPVYHPFKSTLERFGIQVATVPLQYCDGRYSMDFEQIEAQMESGVRAMILCNPHNPVGRVWTKVELNRLVELCLTYDVLLLSDEIHCDILYPQGAKNQCSVLSAHPKADACTIVMTAASKTFNIPGLKCSLIFVKNPELREKIAFTIKKFHNDINIIGLLATETAYTKGDAWVDALCAYLWDNVQFVISYFREHLPSVKVVVPEATYLLWLDFSAYGLSQEDLMCKMREEAKVTLGNGVVSGENGVGFVRMNIGTTRDMIRSGLEAISYAFSGLEK